MWYMVLRSKLKWQVYFKNTVTGQGPFPARRCGFNSRRLPRVSRVQTPPALAHDSRESKAHDALHAGPTSTRGNPMGHIAPDTSPNTADKGPSPLRSKNRPSFSLGRWDDPVSCQSPPPPHTPPSPKNTHNHTHSLSLSLSLTHKHTHTHTDTHTHTHTHPGTHPGTTLTERTKTEKNRGGKETVGVCTFTRSGLQNEAISAIGAGFTIHELMSQTAKLLS